jgi:signal recognition particle subunit SRP19
LKDYDRYILWLEYFDSTLKRREGRRVPLSLATKSPVLSELEEACKILGLDPVSAEAKYPRKFWLNSGYVSIKKKEPKQKTIVEVAKVLSKIRGERKAN